MDTYGARLSTLFVAPTNGFYHFYFRTDDGGYMAMNTNELCSEEPIAKAIANRPNYSDSGNYTATGNGQASGIYLVGGKRYYMEGGPKENSGGDGWMFTFRSQLDPVVPPSTEWANNPALFAAHPVLTGAVAVASIAPSALTVTEGQFADFAVERHRRRTPDGRALVQRWRSATCYDEPAAKIGPFTLADTSVTCLVSNLFSKTVMTCPVTVLPDTVAPTVASARGDGTLFRVYVKFIGMGRSGDCG